jgi:hypothetical protein
MTANLFDAEITPAVQQTQIEAEAGAVSGATRAAPDRDTGSFGQGADG